MLYRFAMLLALLLLPATALAQNAPQLHWERYDNIAEIRTDGSVQIQEQQSLVVDRGPARGMTRVFETGALGAISEIQVFEDGQPLARRGSLDNRDPGTYAGADDGRQARIRVNFRDPSADRHAITIRYVVKRTLVADNARATFNWNFFWNNPDAPEIRDGSVVLRFPGTVSAGDLRLNVSGVPVRQSSSSNSVRWELTQRIQGRELDLTAAFPRTLLAQNAQFRSSGSVGAPNTDAPGVPTPGPAAAVGLGIGGIVFCLFIFLFLFIAFSIIRASMRFQRSRRYPGSAPGYGQGSFGGPFGFPSQRGWRRRRRSDDWDGGFGFPPIIIAPPTQPHSPFDNNNTPFDNTPFDNTPFDSGSGGGSSSWGDSGGGSSSWGDSGGGSSSWGDSGGGSSSWGDMSGGGSSSWGGGDSGGGGGSGGGSFD
jgi:hypothetical protein